MTEQEMFEESFKRPSNYFQLSPHQQWKIDDDLGILDWKGEDLTPEEQKRFQDHYDLIESSDYELLFCEECFQMTNHFNNKCQKCLASK